MKRPRQILTYMEMISFYIECMGFTMKLKIGQKMIMFYIELTRILCGLYFTLFELSISIITLNDI